MVRDISKISASYNPDRERIQYLLNNLACEETWDWFLRNLNQWLICNLSVDLLHPKIAHAKHIRGHLMLFVYLHQHFWAHIFINQIKLLLSKIHEILHWDTARLAMKFCVCLFSIGKMMKEKVNKHKTSYEKRYTKFVPNLLLTIFWKFKRNCPTW